MGSYLSLRVLQRLRAGRTLRHRSGWGGRGKESWSHWGSHPLPGTSHVTRGCWRRSDTGHKTQKLNNCTQSGDTVIRTLLFTPEWIYFIYTSYSLSSHFNATTRSVIWSETWGTWTCGTETEHFGTDTQHFQSMTSCKWEANLVPLHCPRFGCGEDPGLCGRGRDRGRGRGHDRDRG